MPGICRVVAKVSGSPGSVHALRHAADLAHRNDAILIPLHAWVPPEGDIHERKHPCLQLRLLAPRDPCNGGARIGEVLHPRKIAGRCPNDLARVASWWRPRARCIARGHRMWPTSWPDGNALSPGPSDRARDSAAR